MRRWIHVLLALVLAPILAACAKGLGARAVTTQHGDYNVALQRVADEQLLLNVVRMRYSETPSFLEVTSIVTQLTLEVGGQLGASTGNAGSGGGLSG